MQKITPFLWFDSEAEEAMNYYVSIFPDSKVGQVSRYSEAAAKAAGRPAGSVMVASFELSGQGFSAINGGPVFKFTEAISFVIGCENQEEVDHYWSKLGEEGGQPGQCGWLKDKFGVSWQVVPKQLGELMSDSDPQIAQRVMQAMLGMAKIDIAALEKAAQG